MSVRSAVAPLLVIAGVVAGVLLLLLPLGDLTAPPPAAESEARLADAVPAQAPAGTPPAEVERDAPAPARSSVPEGPAVRGRLVQSGQPMGARTVRCVARWGRRDAEVVLTAQTDTEGRFALRDLPAGRVTLDLDGPGVPHPWIRQVAVPDDRDLDLGDLEVQVAGSLRGQVVDENGTPLPGIVVFHNHRPGYSMSSFDRGTALASARDPHVETDADGRFSFQGLPPGKHFVLVEPAERVDRELRAELAAGAHRDLGVIRLEPGCMVRGQVFDERGAAVAGARVSPASGVFSSPARRKGVLTASDGSFALRGLSRHAQIVVEADGFEPNKVRIQQDAPPLVIELKRALVLEGRLSGHAGRPTTVQLEGNPKGRGSLPPSFAYAQLGGDHEVAADGSFRIEGLGPGDYLARATTPGVGLSVPVAFSLPRDEPLQLEIVRDATVEVHVVDDLGAPIAGARVVRDPGIEEYPDLYRPGADGLAKRILGAWRANKRTAETDADGIAQLSVEPGVALALAADHGEHLPAALIVAAGDGTGPLRIALARAGKLGGQLSDASGRTRFALGVRAWPADPTAAEANRQSRSISMSVDAQGRFRSPPLRPGRYRVAVDRFNMTWENDPSRRLPDVRPLVGGGVDPRGQVEVEVVAGEEARVDLTTPPLGRIRGTVLAGAWPVPGVAVWAVTPGDTRALSRGQDDDDAFESSPYTRTDSEGRYEILFADVGEWRLYARHPDAAYPTGPVVVRATDHGGDVVQDIALSGAEIRGRYDVSHVPEQDRQWFVAYLFRLAKASDDAFFSPHHGLPKSWGMRKEPVGTTGTFAFRFLPTGTWVLRLVDRSDRIVYWQVVETAPGQTVDLGEVAPRAMVGATVSYRNPEVTGVWVRQPIGGAAVFVATCQAREGKIALPPLPPGRYTIEPFGSRARFGFGISGPSLASPVELTIHADGTTTPATVFGEK